DGGRIGEHADDGVARLRQLRRGGGDRGASVLDRLQLVGGAVPGGDLVPDLDEPLRDSGAHLAYAGDPDLHASPSEVMSEPCYFIRSLILSSAARAHSSSKLPPGAPPTPIPPIGLPPAMIVTPPGVNVTLGRLPSDAVVLGFLLMRSKISLVEPSLR